MATLALGSRVQGPGVSSSRPRAKVALPRRGPGAYNPKGTVDIVVKPKGWPLLCSPYVLTRGRRAAEHNRSGREEHCVANRVVGIRGDKGPGECRVQGRVGVGRVLDCVFLAFR